MSALIRWLSKPFITPIDVAAIAGAGLLAEWIGLWSILVVFPLLIASTAVERRYWLTRERSRV